MYSIYDLYPEFLLLNPNRDVSNYWLGSDTEKKFNTNLKIQPANWYYRTNSVTYKLNSNKYRCPEWEEINWSESWIVLGCSCVQGIGLDESDVLSSRLAELLNSSVINLGMGATGPNAIMFNSIRLIDNDIRPKGVIILNGDFALTRLSLFMQKESVSLGYWMINQVRPSEEFSYSDLYSLWLRSTGHAETHSYMSLRGAISMWKAENVPTFYFNIEQDLPGSVDKARDLLHSGRETIKLWANTIATKILNSN